jgi:ABC-type enterochelin transport system substrate-binding protein
MGELRVDFIDRLNDNHVAVLDRLDIITSGQSAAEERDRAQGKQIDDNKVDIKTNAVNITKVRNLNTGIALLASTIAGILGLQK